MMSAWLPTLSVIFLTAIALTWASSPPVGAIGRRAWMAGLLVAGSVAIAVTVWQTRTLVDEAGAVAGTSTSPQPSHREANEREVSELTKEVKALKDRVRVLEQHKQVRAIAPDAAENLAMYLKQFGSHRVVVSCIPGSIEAYQYANQLVNALKAANWDAHGPEVTKMFGNVRAPGINVYVNPDDHSDTAKVLLDGFAKFNIPYQARVTPTQAIPDSETVELFIGQQQSDQVSAGGD
jgi:hypothetical protein